ncbi:hypothetical protein BGZ97_003405 [Linnemannia gamsii]|uniref:Uncharacterized protein n=1 Tax=Linnemannia gamsii TaxID=64522 RepID=A0A9P6RM76_9FUNG|nr:hypothetical protein BGZ97_003405 [Linnemannia gamsii]
MTASSPPRLPNPWAHTKYRAGFPSTLSSELTMMQTSNLIREKLDWWKKCLDPEILAKWRTELRVAGEAAAEAAKASAPEPKDSLDYSTFFLLRDEEMDYVFEELRWYAQKRQEQVERGAAAPIEVGIEGTRRCDGLIYEELKERLMACVKRLEDVPDHLKDWHPGSNRQVLDLVHPSLFPLIAGQTFVSNEETNPALGWTGEGAVIEKCPQVGGTKDDQFYSKRFQWLPTDFDITPDGKIKAKSYINNLHPENHKLMYPVLEEILDAFLPLFEEVLGEMRAFETKVKRLTPDPYGWYGEDPPGLEDFSDEDDYYDYIDTRVPQPAAVPKFAPPSETPKYDLRTAGRERPLQVIVKLANIELTPNNPKYEGGTWHVEGMANENIVATGIYYYHTENITESRLDFRIQVEEPRYEQSDQEGMWYMYRLYDGDAVVQHLDGIVTKQDRCIVFPNIYQHQVQPFELQDPTRPGSRKILVFFLINPEEDPIVSTTFVPPQQADWYPLIEVLQEIEPRLPLEIGQMIVGLMDRSRLMGLEEAKRHREELMEERKFFVKTTNDEVFARPFSLCEH